MASADIATLPTLGLTEQEVRIASFLATRLFEQRPYLQLRGLYYDGLQKMQDLGISIPPSLSKLRTVIGWPRVGVDAISNRCRVEGFRYPEQPKTDADVWSIWQANNLDSESQLAHIDALVYGRCYLVVGSGDDTTFGQPLVTAESPLNMTALWDARMRRVTAAFQVYLDSDFTSDMYGQQIAALYLPNSTIHLGRQGTNILNNKNAGGWQVITRDNHMLGRVPVVRMANRCRLNNRDGLSEITPEWMNTTDSATRTLLSMELGREFYAAPRRYILGASEDQFVKSDGSPVSAWETYLSKVWAIPAPDDGAPNPQVGEFKSGDPKAYTELIDAYAKIMSGEMGVPPHFLGVYSDGNPASADAIRSGYEELTVRSTNKHIQFGDAWEDAMRLALLIRDGSLPPESYRMETDWMDPSPRTPASTAQAIFQMVEAGAVPPTSDVITKRLGFSAMERAQMVLDREKDQAEGILAELSHTLIGKAARVDKAMFADIAASDTVPGTPGKKIPVAEPAAPVEPAKP
jgi:hypothetical protein